MNLNGEVDFELLGHQYQGRWTWNVYEKVKEETGKCPYAVFTRIAEKASLFVANEMLKTDAGVTSSCADLAEIVSAKFAYSLLYHLAKENDRSVSPEEIQHGILHEGTTPAVITIEKDEEVDCQGYCFKVMEIAIELLGVGSPKKKATNPNFLHLLINKLRK